MWLPYLTIFQSSSGFGIAIVLTLSYNVLKNDSTKTRLAVGNLGVVSVSIFNAV